MCGEKQDKDSAVGIFDDMTVLLGRGMDAADKRSQLIKIQSELNQIAKSKELALAELGRAVLEQEGSDKLFVSKFAAQVKAVGDLEEREDLLRKRIEDLQTGKTLVSGFAMQTANAAVEGCACPSCGAMVTLDAMYCPSCGDNLATLKENYRICPRCNVYYHSDYAFCETCGSKTEALPLPQSPMSNLESGHTSEWISGEGVEGVALGTSQGRDEGEDSCPSCGALRKPGTAFCGACGNRYQD